MLSLGGAVAAGSGPRGGASSASVALYSADPPALDAFHSFDPESYSTISCINDPLLSLAPNGEIEPALATAWFARSPTELDLTLREGVRFHNGDPFDADDVVATFRAHREPTPSPFAAFFGSIKECQKLGKYAVRLVTAFPDALLLRRLFIGGIYPHRVLEQAGRDAFAEQPIGTGAYRFVHWRRGQEIVLRRWPEHWAGRATVDELRLPIVRQKEWVDLLVRGDLDVALNIDCHDAIRAARRGLIVRSQPAALSQWLLWANRGPLADVRVRRALNHAVDRTVLVAATEHGSALVQRTIATPDQVGYQADVPGYHYSPALARQLLAEAGYAQGFALRGLVSESSTALYAAVRAFLERVGVSLEAEILPRAEWLRRATGPRKEGRPRYDGDFVLASVDNPLLHSLFHHFIFLYSGGPFSLTTSPDYDQRFRVAATAPSEQAAARLAELEVYARDEAL
jgi:peptide/nickel transport system substrate-binding protein